VSIIGVDCDAGLPGDRRSSTTDDGEADGVDGDDDLADSADPNSGRRISAIEKQVDL
jgi:hypothetical protein